MDREQIIQLGKYLTDSILSQRIIPANLFRNISSAIPGDSRVNYNLFLNIWKKRNSNGFLNIDQPLIFSRGFNNESTTEEQLSSYLPEEKILINKDLFRGHLEKIDLVNIKNSEQNRLIDILNRESIGLSHNDVLLYYNLLKINQISQKTDISTIPADSNRDYPGELYRLASKAFNLTPIAIKKVNGGRLIEHKAIIDLLTNAVDKKRIKPQVLTICLGHHNRRFIDFFNDFMVYFIGQRGDSVQEILSYIGLYILFNGAPLEKMSTLNLSSNIQAFVNDRIGRVKSVYYVAMLFLHTYNVLLVAQICEISAKYQNSPLDQKLKLEKLYSADNRRALLVNNAVNIATRKISSYKSESLEVLSAFKRFSANKNEKVSAKDIFDTDWRI